MAHGLFHVSYDFVPMFLNMTKPDRFLSKKQIEAKNAEEFCNLPRTLELLCCFYYELDYAEFIDDIEQTKKAFTEAIRRFMNFLKQLSALFTYKPQPFTPHITDTFISPAKLFTLTVTHYTHTLSRP